MIYKKNLYCSNLKFSGVIRGTQGGVAMLKGLLICDAWMQHANTFHLS